jgi:hypothetical protein
MLTAAAAAAAVASLLASSLPALLGSVVIGTIGGLAQMVQVRAQRSIEQRDAVAALNRQLYASRSGDLQKVRDVDNPLLLGVHPALKVTGKDGEDVKVDQAPPFIRRDLSDELEQALSASRFVLVVGESTAGKSRAAYEAMRAKLPDHVLIRPQSREDLPAALALAEQHRQSVVWLENLELYLGTDGLTTGLLSRLLAEPDRHTVLLATMRAHERARYSGRLMTGEIGETERHALRLAGEVLRLAYEVRIQRLWSLEERERAANDVHDTRITMALQHADRFGVAQYLAAGPALFEDWQNAWGSWPEGRPRGAALVTAAVDLRRAGHHTPAPVEFLQRLHKLYLADPSRAYLRAESWQEALAWATEPLHSTSSLLIPAGDGHYLAFDYLADAVDMTPGAGPVPPVGAEYCVTSCDLGVFVEEAAKPVSSDDLDVGVGGMG